MARTRARKKDLSAPAEAEAPAITSTAASDPTPTTASATLTVPESPTPPPATSETPAPAERSHATQHNPGRQPGQSHADAVGSRPKRQPGYTSPFTDRVIGAHRLEHHDPYLSIIRFDEKPSEQVRQKLHDEHFTWSQRNSEWKRTINFESRQQDREDARRVFDEVCQMIRTERGINHGYGSPS